MKIRVELFVRKLDGVGCPSVTAEPHPPALVVESCWPPSDGLVTILYDTGKGISVSAQELRAAIDAVTRAV